MTPIREISAAAQFEILAPLSVGGMGQVFLARRIGAHGFQKLIALKTIRPDLLEHEEMKAMFVDEAQLLARLDHPALAQVYDFVEQGQPFLAMEYVAGIPLNKLIRQRNERLPPAIVARIAIEVCRGLHVAHELTDLEGKPLGVVHRDISPQNLMLTFDGRMKILDFGVAYMLDRQAASTQTGMFKGKLAYIAPEQMTGKRADRRSDLYSLAVVMHELLTGQRLFSKKKDGSAGVDRRDNVPKPSSIAPFAIPPELDDIVLKGLQPKPRSRYSDAREMAQALEDYLQVAGGESLPSFAERELAQDRERHRIWLQEVADGKAAPSTAATQPNDPPPRKPPPLPPRDEGSIEIQLNESSLFAPPPTRRSGLFLALAIVVGAFIVGAWLLFPAVMNENTRRLATWAIDGAKSLQRDLFGDARDEK